MVNSRLTGMEERVVIRAVLTPSDVEDSTTSESSSYSESSSSSNESSSSSETTTSSESISRRTSDPSSIEIINEDASKIDEVNRMTIICGKIFDIRYKYSTNKDFKDICEFLDEAIRVIPVLREYISLHIEYYRILDSLDHDTDDDTRHYIGNYYDDPAHLCSRLSESSHGEEFDEGFTRMYEIQTHMDSLLPYGCKYFKFGYDLSQYGDVVEFIENILQNKFNPKTRFRFVFYASEARHQDWKDICEYLESKLGMLKHHPYRKISPIIYMNIDKLDRDWQIKRFIEEYGDKLLEMFGIEKDISTITYKENYLSRILRLESLGIVRYFKSERCCPICGYRNDFDKRVCDRCGKNRKSCPMIRKLNSSIHEFLQYSKFMEEGLSEKVKINFLLENPIFLKLEKYGDLGKIIHDENDKYHQLEQTCATIELTYRILKYSMRSFRIFVCSVYRQTSDAREKNKLMKFLEIFNKKYPNSSEVLSRFLGILI